MVDKDWKYPTSIRDVVIGEKSEVINIADIKVKCYEFAIEVTKNGIYKPGEVLDKAKDIFDWIMDNEAFKNQS